MNMYLFRAFYKIIFIQDDKVHNAKLLITLSRRDHGRKTKLSTKELIRRDNRRY